ncbi:MAG: M23 family metallopeptidase, partial [Tannerella sp.]|nr:M23 family metallopeptidase [Tannerella sp.]
MWHKIIYLAFLPVAGVSLAEAQGLRNPLDVAPPYLSGNFGELRANHFHSGIDFKTQGEEGKSVHAVRDGYVCRIAVSPWGYGNVIYLAHPGDSIKTVYGHLQRFAGKIADYVKEEQYAAERFSVDLTPAPEQFPVSRGDLVAFSGNTGGSGGPHLHFEVRDLQTDDPVDPLPFYEGRIGDTRPPGVRAVTVHPVEGQGAVNRSMQKTVVHRSGASAPDEPIEAWGKIGFSIRTDDRMDGTTNVYGVKEISMSVDGEELFYSFL